MTAEQHAGRLLSATLRVLIDDHGLHMTVHGRFQRRPTLSALAAHDELQNAMPSAEALSFLMWDREYFSKPAVPLALPQSGLDKLLTDIWKAGSSPTSSTLIWLA